MPRTASSMRWLIDPALAAGLALVLASSAPAAAFLIDIPAQPRSGVADAAPAPAAKIYRSTALRHAKRPNGEAKPPLAQGPFQIVVAIARQQVTLFGQDGPIARAAVSTGVPAHPTPLGVFTVLSKNKWHKSNIYSGAPMPYMQRLTWSGIALHAGPLPGYPASHGCIRLPLDFAIRLWGATKIGARVIVTREPAAPVEIAHRNLFVPKKPEEKVLPVASAAEPTDSATRLTADPAAVATLQVTGTIAVTPTEARPASEPPRRNGPLSVFASRKQNRLFVRQGFVPLFDLPLTIEAPDRPLGTHVFTAMALQNDGAAMRWTVVSIPSGSPQRTDRAGKRSKTKFHDRREPPVAVEPTMPSAAAALDRITLPAEAVEKISTLLSPGASLIVSDNALSDETGTDTDFIVLTR